jgi:hypothetical protein
MNNEKFLYHGSQIQGIKEFVPKEAGYGKKYVYATSEIALAVIFSCKGRSSYIANWGTGKNPGNVPFFTERKKGIINELYSGKEASIYVFSREGFYHDKRMSSHEWISEKKVKPIKEIKIKDVKKYLMRLSKEGKIKITLYKKELKDCTDEAILNLTNEIEKKYGYESALQGIKKYYPPLEKKFIQSTHQQKRRACKP